RIDSERTEIQVCHVAEGDVDAPGLLARDIDVAVPDLENRVRNAAGLIRGPGEEIAKRLLREELRFIAAERDVARTDDVDFVLDLDVEIIDGNTQVGEVGSPYEPGSKRFR